MGRVYNKVQAGKAYYYVPVMLDRIDVRTTLEEGNQVRVVNLHGCPRANTMGHAHVATLSGHFIGLVHVNSLLTRAQYIEYLRVKIARLETENR